LCIVRHFEEKVKKLKTSKGAFCPTHGAKRPTRGVLPHIMGLCMGQNAPCKSLT